MVITQNFYQIIHHLFTQIISKRREEITQELVILKNKKRHERQQAWSCQGNKLSFYILPQKGMNRMDTQRIVLETEEKEFIETVISFVTEKGWTISNLQNAVSKVEDYMKKNATLTELTIGMPAQIKD